MFSLLIKEHTGPSTPDTVRQHLVSEVRRILDTNPAVSASAVAGTAVINADLNRLSWGDFLLLVPLTVVVASVVLLGMLRFRWRTTRGDPDAGRPVDGSADRGDAVLGPAVHDGDDCAPRVVLHAGDRLQPARHELDREPPSRGRQHRERTGARTWRHLARPIIVSNVTTALGFGLLAVIPVTPVQEMAIFGAAAELLSGLHVVFVLPMCLYWFGAARELAGERTMFIGEGRIVDALGALAAWLERLQRFRFRLLIPVAAICVVMAWLISTVSYDSTYLTMIQPQERLRIDYARFEAAGLPSAQLSIVSCAARTSHQSSAPR